MTRIINGDTILVLTDGESLPRRVKLIGVEMSESTSSNSLVLDNNKAAQEYTKRKRARSHTMELSGKQVWLEYDFGALDRYSPYCVRLDNRPRMGYAGATGR